MCLIRWNYSPDVLTLSIAPFASGKGIEDAHFADDEIGTHMPELPTLTALIGEKLRTRIKLSQFRPLFVMLSGLRCLNFIFFKKFYLFSFFGFYFTFFLLWSCLNCAAAFLSAFLPMSFSFLKGDGSLSKRLTE